MHFSDPRETGSEDRFAFELTSALRSEGTVDLRSPEVPTVLSGGCNTNWLCLSQRHTWLAADKAAHASACMHRRVRFDTLKGDMRGKSSSRLMCAGERETSHSLFPQRQRFGGEQAIHPMFCRSVHNSTPRRWSIRCWRTGCPRTGDQRKVLSTTN